MLTYPASLSGELGYKQPGSSITQDMGSLFYRESNVPRRVSLSLTILENEKVPLYWGGGVPTSLFFFIPLIMERKLGIIKHLGKTSHTDVGIKNISRKIKCEGTKSGRKK